MLLSTAFDETLKPVTPPVYVAFCTVEGASRLAVIARIESKDCVGRLWGHWFSSRTRMGEFKEIPWEFTTNTEHLHADLAEDCISLLRAGDELPEGLVRKFLITE
jgi:hypothetical protein